MALAARRVGRSFMRGKIRNSRLALALIGLRHSPTLLNPSTLQPFNPSTLMCPLKSSLKAPVRAFGEVVLLIDASEITPWTIAVGGCGIG
jgi:hypothetical protein